MATDLAVIKNLKTRGRCFATFTIKHSYPHCWRCETPLLPYVTTSWFVKVEAIKEKLLKNNAKTAWVPEHLRDGRFGKWLENARDWAVSRNRYWGTPLPIWRSEDKKHVKVISSRDDLFMHCPSRFTKVTALRHAQSEGNVQHIYQGKLPGTPLTEIGKEQARAAANAIAAEKIKPVAIYTSPLDRTLQTATIIGDAIGLTPITDSRLQEITFGDYEGKKIDFSDLALVKARRAKKLEANAPESIYHYPGMETWAQVHLRISDVLKEILAKHKGEHVVIVSHADPLLNLKHFFTQEDPVKISHQPYPNYATPCAYYWDHQTKQQLDLHKETVDMLTWKDNNGMIFRRIPEVFDCWFESGSMPVAQEHFPFSFEQTAMRPEKKKLSKLSIPPGFPADFIAEGLDQTRGWFYTLMVLSTALFDMPAFRHCVVNGIVLAEDGRKMSKRLKNYPEPAAVIEQHGADALRFALMASPAVRAEDLRFSEKIVEHALRNVLLPLWNAYGFFVTYANAARFVPSDTRRHSPHPLDRWIRAEVQDLSNRMTEQLEHYDLSATCSELYATIDALTNWYIRLSRRRFAGKTSANGFEQEEDVHEQQHEALHTLYDVLLSMIQLLAPICPFLSDAIYQNIVDDEHGSVHLTDWPEPRPLSAEDAALVAKHRILRTIVSLGLRVRAEQKIKVRQPLAAAAIVIPPALLRNSMLTPEDHELLRSELHVKHLTVQADPKGLGTPIAAVNARTVGPRLGGKVQALIAAGKRGEFRLEKDGTIVILGEVLQPGEFAISYQGLEGQNIAADQGIIVSVDTRITDDLQEEGLVRDLIRGVQRLRKEQGLSHTDRITLQIDGLNDLLEEHGATVAKETHAVLGPAKGNPVALDLGGTRIHVIISRM
jgi:isoleucyl-tRNA synthetase